MTIEKLAGYDPLLVFALPSEEAGEFGSYKKCFTGIGKINAAYQLTKAIQQQRPDLIINLGSAGSNVFRQGTIVCCTAFIQRDMDVCGLGYAPYETPFSPLPAVWRSGIKLEGVEEGICGTGDSFEMDHHKTDYNVIDMEAYALAYIAAQEHIPFLCLKYISDGADGTAAADWTEQVHKAAKALKVILQDEESETYDGARRLG